jgi:hypothetical protein
MAGQFRGTITLTCQNIVANKWMAKEDFDYPLPPAVK